MQSNCFRPFSVSMIKVSARQILEGTNASFGQTILVVGADTGKSKALLILGATVNPSICSEHTVVSMIRLYIDALIRT